MKNLTVHIIGGTGSMGNWLRNFFQGQGVLVTVSGSKIKNPQELRQADIVVISVPISVAPMVISKIAQEITNQTLLVDVSSSKEETAKALRKTGRPALAIHLLFGPTVSAVANQKIIFSTIKSSPLVGSLKQLFQSSGALVLEMSPKEHDTQMLHVQALTHFVNLSLAKILLTNKIGLSGQISTPVFLAQLATINRVISQSPSLLTEIQLGDTRFVKLLDQLILLEQELKQLISKKDSKALTRKINKIHGSIDSVRLQKVKGRTLKLSINSRHLTGKIAFLGPKGTFSHQVSLSVAKEKQLVPCETIPQVFEAVKLGRAKYGVVPAENSTEGTVRETLDLLVDQDLKTVGSLSLPIHQCLLSFERSLNRIQKVISHSQALAQCREWLNNNLSSVVLESANSTVAPIDNPGNKQGVGFICSKVAAKLYKLNVLASKIEDLEENITKFYIISRNNQDGLNSSRTLLFLTVLNRVGILRDILAVLADLGINLSKLESRPSREKIWDYHFFIEAEVFEDDPKLTEALNILRQYCPVIKVLGAV